MFKASVVLILALSSFTAFAGPRGGNTGIVPPYILEAIKAYEAKKAAANVECSNEEEGISFSSEKSTLTFGDEEVALNCELVDNEGPVHPDQSVAIWSCVEDRGGHGRLIVDVATVGIIPAILAHVSREQMFPLPPQKFATLGCPIN